MTDDLPTRLPPPTLISNLTAVCSPTDPSSEHVTYHGSGEALEHGGESNDTGGGITITEDHHHK